MSIFSAIKKLFGLGSSSTTLQPGDRMLICEDCDSQFVFDVGEQRFFREKGFTEPKRCPKCRKRVRFRMRRRGRGHGGQNQGHQQSNHNQHHEQHQHNEGRRRGRHHGRRHGVIDGTSPYADER